MPVLYIPILPARQRFLRQYRAYPELFALLGGQVPDLRGLFLRGHGGNSAALGVKQTDAIRNITGQFVQISVGPEQGAFFDIRSQGGNNYGGGWWGSTVIGFDASRVVPTAEENRPVNQAVRYFIRARP